MERVLLRVVLDSPLDNQFDYWYEYEANQVIPKPGQLVRVPFARREVSALVVALPETTAVDASKIKTVIYAETSLPALSANWLALCRFAGDYYQRPLGEVALPALPKHLRHGKPSSLRRATKQFQKWQAALNENVSVTPILNGEQQQACDTILASPSYQAHLLFGVTGSGKTEVYLQAAAGILARELHAQVLFLVPEINLTPQFEAQIRQRFPHYLLATLHSAMAEGERLAHWLAAHQGAARIILGTRLAILASLPHLRLIIVDEEHDPSYKQQEGLRYSARDLAVWRAHQLQIPVVLGSATPSLESWQAAQQGKYRLLSLRQRAVSSARLPVVKILDVNRVTTQHGLSDKAIAAISDRLQKGEQSLLFLNRRGYAPVLSCDACGWVCPCPRCSVKLVVHKGDQRLRCHHCGYEQRIPRACPDCGNQDMQAWGRGTQRLEEGLQELFPQARVFRIDADSTRLKGSAELAFAKVHQGEVDILVGTQMVAKGHDFRKLTLVIAMNPDMSLFAQDFRASERLFAQLMQVAGRAGRHHLAEAAHQAEVLVQSRYPDHPLYHALSAHDFPGFAHSLIAERQQAHLPPFVYQALLRAEARELEPALAFLQHARSLVDIAGIQAHDAVPMNLVKLANVHRAQVLLESATRPMLQQFLKYWVQQLREIKTRVRWQIEVDPNEI